MLAGLIVGKRLVKRDDLKNDFRFGNLNGLFPVNLAVKNAIKLDDLKDPLHNGVHTIDTSPSLPPGGFVVFFHR